MFEITIKGDTLAELIESAAEMSAALDQVAAGPAPKAKTRKAKAEPVAEEPETEDAALEAELAAPVEPMPATAKAVVDAGTGKPVAQTTTDEGPVKMTKDDVKAMAAKLAAKDAAKLGELLKKQGAAKLSEVPDAKLGDFASDVMEALG